MKLINLIRDKFNAFRTISQDWYTRNRVYEYVGAIAPGGQSSRFVASIFTRQNSPKNAYYIQEISNDRIIRFNATEINYERLLRTTKKISVTRKDKITYSFIDHSGTEPELISGDREQIETQLIKLLENIGLNSYSKLQITNFLKLYRKSFKLKKELNNIHKNYKINYSLDLESPNNNIKISLENVGSFLNNLKNKLHIYRSNNDKIHIYDLAFADNESIYFQNMKIAHEMLFKNELVSATDYKSMLSELLNVSIADKNLNIKDVVKKKGLYDFILLSEKIVINQGEIEAAISTEVNPEQPSDESVIKIGIEVDKSIYEDPKAWDNQNSNTTLISEEIIDQEVSEILEHNFNF